MKRKLSNILVTGSCGLVGSEVVQYYVSRAIRIIGVDNNSRQRYFGDAGSILDIRERLIRKYSTYTHHDIDIRDREKMSDLFDNHEFDAIIHCAAQPSHDKSASITCEDFAVNAAGTVQLLELARNSCNSAPFVFLSTNKVYGDNPNRIDFVELETRWEHPMGEEWRGFDETYSVDQCIHSMFGVSKLAADLAVQEFGKNFGMYTASFRCGCISGERQKGVELHGFLSHLLKVAKDNGVFTVFGYKGKQVRDVIHSHDLVRAIDKFVNKPRVGEVYNLGGGRKNSISLSECIELVNQKLGRKLATRYNPDARVGDHICYITDSSKFQSHYPDWGVTFDLNQIVQEQLL